MTKNYFIPVLALALFLGGCKQTKDALGLSRETPDEFCIKKYPRLEMPKDFCNLPEPTPGVVPRGEKEVSDQAKEILFGDDTAKETVTGAEEDLLVKANVSEADKSIRAKVAKEHSEEKANSVSTLDILLGRKSEVKGNPINPHDEETTLEVPEEFKK